MSVYSFKSIAVVPSGKDFIDIVLSKTQRKTPTVVHKGYQISRIRQFYMRKVKFTQKTIDERLMRIVSEFPRMDDVHPFYTDLMHVLYDRDHYKVALAQLGAVRHMVDSVGRDYIRLLKYGDSLYRCKQLKRAALGRMATACKKLNNALVYLERVRQHLARLPSIDPICRTLLITGFPNVGKSSFMNSVTRADVEVQPYAFTTKSLYVGHTDFQYATWQVVDTPGILDHPLEERNVIEMQAITALAHLRACVLFFMDLSGQCGYTIAQQLSLFESIRPLFANKPLVVVFNKSDVCTIDDVSPEERAAVLATVQNAGAHWVTASTLTADGVGDVKKLACELLLQHRTEEKEASSKFASIESRLYCALPQPRDEIERPPFVPTSVETEGESAMRRKVQRDYEWEGGGPGRYQADERLTWDLDNPEWTHDIVPHIMDGHNIFDCVDPDIHERLLELENEEEDRVAERDFSAARAVPAYSMDEATQESVQFIRDRIKLLRMDRALRTSSARRTPSQQAAIKRFESSIGGSSRSASRGRSRQPRSASADALSRDRSGSVVSTKTTRSMSGLSASRDRCMSVQRGEGYRSVSQKLRAVKLSKVKSSSRSRASKMGEGDRVVNNMKPRHLFSGKVNVNGKRDRR